MKGLFADCRHAARLYLRTPGASLIAVCVLAVGMAFVGAFLSLYVDLVLRPHPGFEESSRIATIGRNTGTDLLGITYELVDRISDEVTSVEAAAMFSSSSALVGPEREQMSVSMVSEKFFSGLRPRLALGRGPLAEEHLPGAEPVIVLSYRFWQERFNGDRNVLGGFLELARSQNAFFRTASGDQTSESEPEEDSARFRIIGVMADTLPNIVPYAAGSTFEPAVWVPLERAFPILRGDPGALPRLGTSGTLVRRAPGVPTIAVANELRSRYGNEPALWNGSPGTQLDAIDGIVGNSVTHKEAERQLEMFLAASVLLALVAAANVSLFLLARAPGRRRELGIRMAVGATIRRVARQLATESGLLVIVAAALGLIGSIWLSLYLRGLAFLQRAEWREVTLLDWRVLGLAGAILLALTVFVSLAPILGLKRTGIAALSRQIAARASPAQRLAGTMQIAAAGLFGGAAVAFGWYLGSMLLGSQGYETADRYLLRNSVQAPSANASSIEATRWREAVETIPGVTGVAFGSPVPGAEGTSSPVQIPHPVDPSSEIEVYTGFIERRFVELLGLNLVYGRAPEHGEANVVVVNQMLARTLFGRENAVGERLPGNSRWGREGPEVIGVLEDLSFGHPVAPVRSYAFTGSAGYSSTVIEARLPAAELQQALNPISNTFSAFMIYFRPLKAVRNDLIAPDRARGFLTIATAMLVVLLAAFGFYGTQRYLVTAGRREYAIRAALGAGPRRLGRLVFLRGLILSVPGLVIGGILAFIVVAWLRDDFVPRGISPAVVTFWVVVGLAALLLAASLGPARQARRTQPAPLLRED